MMKRTIALLLLPVLAAASPGDVTRTLMNEPATLFDVGMIRLANVVEWAESHVTFAWTLEGQSRPVANGLNSHYDSESDMIYVSITVMDENATETQMHNGCEQALRQLQIVISKSLPELFGHVGEAESPVPLDKLRDTFELRCYVSGNTSSEGRFWGSMSLDYADEMTVGKWPTSN